MFHRSTNPKKDDDDESNLFSGMISAIMTMHEKLSGTNIQKFEDNAGKFLFFSRKGLIFIVRAKLNISDDKIRKQVSILQDQFIKKYKDKLDEFKGDVAEFKMFETDLDAIFVQMSRAQKWGRELDALKL
ncbi:MAG TPA: hypothetical protein VKM55_04970 [Candidatus Lokiarchaeia archaeon]|nr:hypothetical protein [Candidatus Lokiarchaeia archaeon]